MGVRERKEERLKELVKVLNDGRSWWARILGQSYRLVPGEKRGEYRIVATRSGKDLAVCVLTPSTRSWVVHAREWSFDRLERATTKVEDHPLYWDAGSRTLSWCNFILTLNPRTG